MIETDKLKAAAPAERLISAAPADRQEDAIERALRPKRLAEYVGQAKIREQLEIFIQAARNRNEALSITASRTDRPSSRNWLANSTIRMPFFAAIPIRMIRPIWL